MSTPRNIILIQMIRAYYDKTTDIVVLPSVYQSKQFCCDYHKICEMEKHEDYQRDYVGKLTCLFPSIPFSVAGADVLTIYYI